MSRIYRRNRVWYLDCVVDGKRVRHSLGTGSKKMAQEALKAFEGQRILQSVGVLPADRSQTPIRQWAEHCLAVWEAERGPRTLETYRISMRHFERFLDDHPELVDLSDIRPSHLDAYKTWRRKEVAAATVNGDLTVIGRMLQMAVEDDRIEKNPKAKVKALKTVQKPPEFLSKEQVEALLRPDTPYRDEWATFVYTGMRRNELLFLEWDDVDFKAGTVTVRSHEGFDPKSGKSRTIPLHQDLRKILRARPRDDERVFPEWRSRSRNQLLREFRKALALHPDVFPDPERYTVHHLRHTFASHLVMSGAGLDVVRDLLGHSSVQTTEIYAHLTKDHLKMAVDRLTF